MMEEAKTKILVPDMYSVVISTKVCSLGHLKGISHWDQNSRASH